MDRFTTIPPTLAKAKKELAGLDALLHAKEWARAAIVFAYTVDEGRGQPGRGKGTSRNSATFTEFADLGIKGLSHHKAVARYHRAWAAEVAAGRAELSEPGAEVKLPDTPWPPDSILDAAGPAITERAQAVAAAGEGPVAGTIATVLKNPAAVRAAIRHDPGLRELAVEALAETAATPEGASAGIDAAARIGESYRKGGDERRAVRKEHAPDTPLSRAAEGAADNAASAADMIDDMVMFEDVARKLRDKAAVLRARPPLDDDHRRSLLGHATKVREALGELIAAIEQSEFSVPDSPPLT